MKDPVNSSSVNACAYMYAWPYLFVDAKEFLTVLLLIRRGIAIFNSTTIVLQHGSNYNCALWCFLLWERYRLISSSKPFDIC